LKLNSHNFIKVSYRNKI